MNSKEAIAVLHNNQYQKHLGNGEYDYIHPLTDAEAKAIEELIQQQDKMLELAIYKLSACCCGFIKDCGMDDEQTCEDCWRKYLQGEVGK